MAENGERFGILSREATVAHGDKYAALTNAMNKGDRASIASIAAELAGLNSRDNSHIKRLDSKAAKVIDLNSRYSASLQNQQLKEGNDLLRAMLKEQTKKKQSTEYNGDVKVVKFGNSTRVIKRAK